MTVQTGRLEERTHDMRLFSRKQRRDAQLSRAQRDLAEVFVDTCTQGGEALDYSVSALDRLDGIVDRLLAAKPTRPVAGAMARGIAAFFGEVIVGAGKAEWALEAGTEHVLLAMLPDRLPVINVLNVVRRRMNQGPDDALQTLADSCLQGFVRPEDATQSTDPT